MTKFRFLIRYRLLIILLTIGFFLSGMAILWLQPRWAIDSISNAVCPGALYYVPTDQPIVALTIDDGPDDQRIGEANTTEKILKVLAKHDAEATFFLISSRIKNKNQDLIAKMVRQGHELGNHLTVDTPSIKLPLPEFKSALQTAEREILSAADGNITLEWMRPGSGLCNPAMAEIAKQQGYK